MPYGSVKIFEDNYDQDIRPILSAVMDEEQIKRSLFYLAEYNTLKAEYMENETEWAAIEEMYASEKETPDDDDSPNAFVNVILPSVEGQVASMTEQNISANVRGKGYADQAFGRTSGIIANTTLKENNIRQKAKRLARRYCLFGNAVAMYGWNPDAFDGKGMFDIETPYPGFVLVDGKIKDMENLQKAEFIIHEVGQVSVLYAQRKWGKDKANAIMLGNNSKTFAGTAAESGDDQYSFTLLRVWTRNNDYENLQLIEMSLCGVILFESDPSKPYYKYVMNKYPCRFAGAYPREGRFLRFGDGKLLMPVQDLLNKLFDEIILAIRFSSQRRTFIDPRANIKVSEFDSNPKHPIFAENPKQWIYDQQGGGLNEVVFKLVNLLFTKVQEMTRFSVLMTGQDAGQMTATQAGIQQTQGNTGINDKRCDIKALLEDAVIYGIGLAMEFWPDGQALRISDNEDDFAWVDTAQLSNVPVMIPASNDYTQQWKASNPKSKKPPEWMELKVTKKRKNEFGEDEDETDEEGNPVMERATKMVALDVDVSIGEGLPANKMAQYNIILSLAQLSLPDPMTGQMKPLMSFEQVRKNVESLLGIKIDDPTAEGMAPMVAQRLGIPANMAGMPQVPQMAQMPRGGAQRPINMDANIPGAGVNGMMKGGMR